MAETRIITGIDIGTTTIRALIAEESEDGSAPIFIGYGEVPVEGIRRGIVVNMEKAVKAISDAVEKAEEEADVHIESAVVGIAGDHIKSINSHGVIGVSRSDNEIGEKDSKKASWNSKGVLTHNKR